MNGFYLYGVCSSQKIKKLSDKDASKGIGGEKIFRVPYQDIEAIVSEVSLEEYESSEIQKKAQEDLNWIKEKAVIHEYVIEEATGYPCKFPPAPKLRRAGALRAKRASICANPRGITTVIPMKFGTIFKDKEGLVGSLKKDYLKFKNLFKSLKGKEEHSVKVYLKSKLLEKEVKKKSPIIQNKLEEIKSLPAGRQYFLEEEINEMVKRETRKSVNNYTPLFFERLKGLAEELKENKILGKELTGESDPMVFNGAFLVKKEKVDRFQREVQKLQAEYEKIGFIFESGGPWPPYNFV